MERNFTAYSSYYDLLYKDKDYHKEANYIHECIKRHNKDTTEILELGSGTGNHGLYLQNKGYNIFGIERSPEMVKVAKAKGFECEVGDICELSLSKKFDTAISMFHVFSYLTKNEQLNAAFNAVKNHLRPEGIFIFDVWFSDAVLTQKATPRIKEFENEFTKIIRVANPIKKGMENVIEVVYDILVTDKNTGQLNHFKEVHPMRYFSIPEVRIMAEYHGFQLLGVYDFGSFDQPTEEGWGVNIVLGNNGK